MEYEWDANKRQQNLSKHGYNFACADQVYERVDKLTMEIAMIGECRLMDLAPFGESQKIVVLIYTRRGNVVRIISMRPASRREREHYYGSL